MKISIITVCFNSEETIRDAIESVLSQKYDDIEYIIVDGKSKDNTLSIIHEYDKNIGKLICEPDEGIYDAMNKGISAATGDIVGILNSDDFYENENVLSKIAKIFSNNQNVDIVFGDVIYVMPDNLNKVKRHYNSSNFKAWKLRFGWMPPHPATFVRRKVYERYGLYNLNYEIAADYEIFVRWLLVERLQYIRVNQILVRMRMGGVSTSGFKNSILLNLEIVRACKLNGVYTNILFVLSKIPIKFLELIKRPQNIA